MTTSSEVPAFPQDVCPIFTGTAIPNVTLHTVAGEAFDLNNAIRQQPSVLVFYRGGW
jgi:peroxiredoxin